MSVCGTVFGVNGKGLSRELALASGYGELMERLQLGYVNAGVLQKSGDASIGDSQTVKVSAEDLIRRNKKWYDAYSQRAYDCTGVKISGEQILKQYTEPDGSVMATPYYCVTTKTWEHLPTTLRKNVYTANGCAAGNTMEEAVVQAISEIVERQFQLRALTMETSLPDIPEECLQNYEIAYKIISFLRQSGFEVVVKDVSHGTKFPVICLCLINRETGKYHTHFGAHPVFEIALERTLTESFQGRNISEIAEYEDFCYGKEIISLQYRMHELTKGTAEKMPQFFLKNSNVPYNSNVGFAGRDNKELFKECIAFIEEQGYDLLIRDCSCMGFPTYQVIVPGFSEVFGHRLSEEHNDTCYSQYTARALRNPPAASFEDMLGLLLQASGEGAYKRELKSFTAATQIPAKISLSEENYLLNAAISYICYAMGRYSEVISCINSMLSGTNKTESEYLICVKRYVSMLVNGYQENEIRSILEFFHKKETLQRMYGYLDNGDNPMKPLTLQCDTKNCENCKLHNECMKKETERIKILIKSKYQEMDTRAFVEKL